MEFAVPDHYRRRLRDDVFLGVVDDAARLLHQLRDAGPDLLRRAKQDHGGRDGWNSSTRPRVGSISGSGMSSVEAAALSDEFEDPLQALGVAMCTALLVARDLLGMANDKCAKSVPETKPCWQCTEARAVTDEWCRRCGAAETEPGVPNCEVHRQHRLYAPVWEAGRCRFCYRYRATHDFEDAPLEVLRALEGALLRREMHGTWGGVSEAELRELYQLDRTRRPA